MKILNLTLKKKWFDMILSGEKKEEYREIKQYWETRLFEYPEIFNVLSNNCIECTHRRTSEHNVLVCDIDKKERMGDEMICNINRFEWPSRYFKNYDVIRFTNGYSITSPSFLVECKGIRIGEGFPNWGAPKEDVFIIKLGEIIGTNKVNN